MYSKKYSHNERGGLCWILIVCVDHYVLVCGFLDKMFLALSTSLTISNISLHVALCIIEGFKTKIALFLAMFCVHHCCEEAHL